MSLSLNLPSRRPKRDLSTDRICSVRALVRTPIEGVETKIGNRSAIGVVVKGTMTTVPRRWLMTVSETTAQGRVLACSWPRTGSSSVQYTSPRKYASVMFCRVLRRMTRSAPLGQLRLHEKTSQRRSLDPSHLQILTDLLPAIPGFQPKAPGSRPQLHSWLHMPPPTPGLLCPTRVEQGRQETGCAVWTAQPAPIYWRRHQAAAAALAWAVVFERLT